MKPTQGAIVIWTDGAKNYPAIITRVREYGTCDLAIFLNDVSDPINVRPGYVNFMSQVQFWEAYWPATDGFRPMTWHWPSTPAPSKPDAAGDLV